MGRLYYGNTTDGIEIPDRELARGIVVLWGAQDTEHARIHASDESVDPAELERMIASQVLLLHRLVEAG